MFLLFLIHLKMQNKIFSVTYLCYEIYHISINQKYEKLEVLSHS